jgi:hypothetical protein
MLRSSKLVISAFTAFLLCTAFLFLGFTIGLNAPREPVIKIAELTKIKEVPVVKRVTEYEPSAFHLGTYFEDLTVIETVTRKRLTVSEIMELLDKLPNIKWVSAQCDPPRPFSLDTLAYPQYRYRYTLTQPEWEQLQAYCRERLELDSNPPPDIGAHWRAIADGTPPFGLQVRD